VAIVQIKEDVPWLVFHHRFPEGSQLEMQYAPQPIEGPIVDPSCTARVYLTWC
jgi:hypothetical protein